MIAQTDVQKSAMASSAPMEKTPRCDDDIKLANDAMVVSAENNTARGVVVR